MRPTARERAHERILAGHAVREMSPTEIDSRVSISVTWSCSAMP